MGEYLSRYLAGETRLVWRAIGGFAYAEMPAQMKNDASAICEETMRRVRQNAERIASALISIGYQFGVYPDGRDLTLFRGPVADPDPSMERKLRDLTTSVGSLPLSLTAFWRTMDSICLIGKHPDWPAYSDPLVVEPVDAALEEAQTWHESVQEHGVAEIDPFRIPIAPDKYHKDNVSGGDWYGIALPCATVDAPLSGEPHNTTFVEYLRIAFRSMGFPGVSRIPTRLAELNVELIDF